MEGNGLLYALAVLIPRKESREPLQEAASFSVLVEKRERNRELCEAWAWMGK
jgi:hypothetical protein